ncbi:MAG: hypothetical protein HY300_09770 [Verrucomicrobia bacterium]|nr:hypothetical protein [Verrucomicrobiota bacterium]
MILASSNLHYDYQEAQQWLATMLMICMAFSAAGSFRLEKENGVLELLLCTPMSPSQIIWGRVRALWKQFLPAWLMLLIAPIYFPLASANSVLATIALLFVGAFTALPVLGLLFSFRMRSFVAAVSLTLAVGLVVPHLGYLIMFADSQWLQSANLPSIPLVKLLIARDWLPHRLALQFIVTFVALFFLHRDLKRRAFVLRPGA